MTYEDAFYAGAIALEALLEEYHPTYEFGDNWSSDKWKSVGKRIAKRGSQYDSMAYNERNPELQTWASNMSIAKAASKDRAFDRAIDAEDREKAAALRSQKKAFRQSLHKF